MLIVIKLKTEWSFIKSVEMRFCGVCGGGLGGHLTQTCSAFTSAKLKHRSLKIQNTLVVFN